MWNFKKANWKAFTADMELKVNTLPHDISPQQAEFAFTQALQKCAKKNIPRGKRPNYQPFWNTDLEDQREIREQARKVAEEVDGKTNEECKVDVIKWRKESAVMKRKVLEAKRQTWNKFLNELDYRTDGNKVYRTINALNNKMTRRANHPINRGNQVVSDPRQIAKLFNNFYIERYSLSKEQKRWERKSRNKSKKVVLDKLFSEDFSMEELNKTIKDIQNGKQPGPDNIFPEFLTHLGQSARKFLLMIYNKFWNTKSVSRLTG